MNDYKCERCGATSTATQSEYLEIDELDGPLKGMKRSLVISMGDIAHSGSGFTHMHQLYIDGDEVDLTPFISVKGNSKAKVSGKPLCVIERKGSNGCSGGDSIDSRHYVSLVHNPVSNKWIEKDDLKPNEEIWIADIEDHPVHMLLMELEISSGGENDDSEFDRNINVWKFVHCFSYSFVFTTFCIYCL